MTRLAVLLASTMIAASPAAAQGAGPAPATASSPHGSAGEDIIVTAPFVRELDVLAGTSVLTGTDLQREIRPQIGDSLTRLPGVSATSFTPGASRPVLRGFQGERIRVLTDGLGSIDVSNTSADHAVTIDPLTAERVEVLRGPAVLLFGGQAIGGAVNVLDRRIPREVPEGGFHLDALGIYGSAADERSIGGVADVALGRGGLVLHLGGGFRETDDLRAGGFVLSPIARAEQLELAEEELAEGHADEAAEALENAARRGRIPNSATEQKTAFAGLGLIRDRFNLGGSVSWFNSDYGVPTRPGAGHHHGEEGEEAEEEHGGEAVTIGLEQLRFDLRGEFEVGGGFLDRVRLRLGAADYEHTEFEGDEVGTLFKSNGVEGRLELVQADRNGWRGASGVQFFSRDFEAIGEEAFVAPNETRQFGLFTLQEIEVGRAQVEGAARYERTDVGSDEVGVDRNFNAFSAAVGVSYELASRVRIGANASRTERAPAAEELFSNGPHIATQAFEIGDPALVKEKSWGAEAFLRAETGRFAFNLTGFVNRFDDFIYEAETGEEEDDLPVFRYVQRDARYYGLEAEASATLGEAGGYRFVADGVADYVRATVRGAGPVPRIPPLRLLGALEAQGEALDARIEVEWFDEQERVAAFETPTDGFTLVNASLAWRPFGRDRETTLLLSANNILDVDARRHASFTKDFVPLAGRDVRVSARVSF